MDLLSSSNLLNSVVLLRSRLFFVVFFFLLIIVIILGSRRLLGNRSSSRSPVFHLILAAGSSRREGEYPAVVVEDRATPSRIRRESLENYFTYIATPHRDEQRRGRLSREKPHLRGTSRLFSLIADTPDSSMCADSCSACEPLYYTLVAMLRPSCAGRTRSAGTSGASSIARDSTRMRVSIPPWALNSRVCCKRFNIFMFKEIYEYDFAKFRYLSKYAKSFYKLSIFDEISKSFESLYIRLNFRKRFWSFTIRENIVKVLRWSTTC